MVGVQRNVYVAGQAAYQLSLVPRSSKSLVGSVLIAIDASRRIPLRVEVFARASSALAYSVGFTSLTFGTPAASNFSFTPPPGATVKHVTVPSSPQAACRSLAWASAPSVAAGPWSAPRRSRRPGDIGWRGRVERAAGARPARRHGQARLASGAPEEGAGHDQGTVRQEPAEEHERGAAGQGHQGVRSLKLSQSAEVRRPRRG